MSSQQPLNEQKRTSRFEEFFTGVKYQDLSESRDKSEVIKAVDRHIQEREFESPIALEKDSVYGAVVALPQIARCMDWNKTLCLLCFRAAIMLSLNYFLQCFAIILVGESSQIMDVLAGKMHLCDFGANLENCPDGRGCVGPGGTKFTPPRLYSFDIWSVRNYVRDSLVAVKPEMKEFIMDNVDPGEYGMENYYGRLMACFLFMLVEVRDFFKIWALGSLLAVTPTAADQWVTVDKSSEGEAKTGEEAIKFKVGGMPLFWKLFTVLVVVLPKLFLWYSVCWIGIRWLMETSGILDAILGAITMDFVLTFDELVYDSLGNDATKYVMENIEDFTPPRATKFSQRWRYVVLAVPRRLILTILVLTVFICRYYYLNCERDTTEGTWVSRPMHLPKSTFFSLSNFLTSTVDQESDPYWTWQQVTGQKER